MKNSRSSAPLMLTELIAAILIFIACAAVCVGLFSEAYKTENRSSELTRAVYAAENAAECVAGGADDLETLLGAKESGGGYEIYYDSGWARCGAAAENGYTVRVTFSSDCGVDCGLVSVLRSDGTEVYSVTSAVSEGGAA